MEPIRDVAYALQIEPIDLRQNSLLASLLEQLDSEEALEKDIRMRILDNPEYQELVKNNVLPALRENGTRHRVSIAIAHVQRYAGASQDECYKLLLDWCDKNRRFISSSREEVIEDIKDVVSWVYGDGFVLRKKQKKPHVRKETISSREALYTLSPEIKSMRRLLWIMMCHNNVYGRCALTLDRLARLTGISVVSVVKSIKYLEGEGWILVSRKNPKHIDGKFVRDSNSYFINREKFRHMETCELAEREIPIDFAAMDSGFDKYYYGSILRLLPLEIAQSHVARGEGEILKSTA